MAELDLLTRVAAMLFGEPRMTLDVDLVVFLDTPDLPRVAEAFSSDDYYVPPLDVMRVEAAREQRGHFNLIHVPSGLKADIYCANADPLHHWAIARARGIAVGSTFGTSVRCSSISGTHSIARRCSSGSVVSVSQRNGEP